MGFFNDIGKKTSEGAAKIARETKLRVKTNDNKDKISDLYEEIGKKVYEKHVREEKIDIEEDLKEECSKIDALAKEIEKARVELLSLNKKRQCRKCNAEIEQEAKFCPKCGEKQQPEEVTVFEEAEEKLEDVEIKPENKKKAKIVKASLEEKDNNV